MVDGDRMRMLSASEALIAMSFPADTLRPENHRLTMHMAGNPGQVVLDNKMGSGTTGVAAVQLYRRLIGIEKDTDENGKPRDFNANEMVW